MRYVKGCEPWHLNVIALLSRVGWCHAVAALALRFAGTRWHHGWQDGALQVPDVPSAACPMDATIQWDAWDAPSDSGRCCEP